MSDKKETFQVVTIEFDDGSKAIYSGPAQIDEGLIRSVVSVKATMPRPLPEDCSWGALGAATKQLIDDENSTGRS